MAEQEKQPAETEEFGLVRNDDVDFSAVKRRRRVSPLRRAAGLAAFAAVAVILAAVLEHRLSTTRVRAVGADERLDDSLARAHSRPFGIGKKKKKGISRARKARVVLAYNRIGAAFNAAYDCLDTADMAVRIAMPVLEVGWIDFARRVDAEVPFEGVAVHERLLARVESLAWSTTEEIGVVHEVALREPRGRRPIRAMHATMTELRDCILREVDFRRDRLPLAWLYSRSRPSVVSADSIEVLRQLFKATLRQEHALRENRRRKVESMSRLIDAVQVSY